MDAGKKRKGRRCPPFRLQRTSPHFYHTYASECTSHALIMRFSAKVEKPMKGRAGRALKKPYALYAPLLGVGPFSALSLLREVHTAAYGSHRNQALALLPVGIGASSARENAKCIRIFADSRRNRPPMKSIRLRPSLIPLDARAGFCPWKRFFGPSDGLSSFWGISFVAIRFASCRRDRQGFDFQATAFFGNKKRPGNVIVFSGGFMRLMTASQGGPWVIRQSQTTGNPLSGPSKIKTGSGLWWTI